MRIRPIKEQLGNFGVLQLFSSSIDHKNCRVYSIVYPPPAASELTLPSDNSKRDCTGGKLILVPEYLTEGDV